MQCYVLVLPSQGLSLQWGNLGKSGDIRYRYIPLSSFLWNDTGKRITCGKVTEKRMLLWISFEISERSRRHSFFLNICQPPPEKRDRSWTLCTFFRDRCNLTPDWSLFSPFLLRLSLSPSVWTLGGCAFTKSREKPQDEYLLRQTFDEFQTPKTIRLSFPKKTTAEKKDFARASRKIFGFSFFFLPLFPLADLKVTGSRKKKSQQWCYSRLEQPVFPQQHCFSHNVLCIWHDDKFSEFIREWACGEGRLIWSGTVGVPYGRSFF